MKIKNDDRKITKKNNKNKYVKELLLISNVNVNLDETIEESPTL